MESSEPNKTVPAEYSKFTLLPVSRKIRERYLDYTRQQVQEITKVFVIGILFLIFITLGISIYNKEFTILMEQKTIDPIIIYFFLLTMLLIIIIACYLLSFRWDCTSDLICPLFGIVVFIVCIPVWYEPFDQDPQIMKLKTLTAISTFLYMINIVVGAFFSSNYIVSFAGRLLLWLNSLNIGLKLWGIGMNRALYDLTLFTAWIEVTCYFINF